MSWITQHLQNDMKIIGVSVSIIEKKSRDIQLGYYIEGSHCFCQYPSKESGKEWDELLSLEVNTNRELGKRNFVCLHLLWLPLAHEERRGEQAHSGWRVPAGA